MKRVLRWWRAAGPVWCWAVPLLLLAVVALIDWIRLDAEGVARPTEGRRLLLRVGVVCAVAGVVMVGGVFVTKGRWRLQGLGLLALLFGIAGLFVRVIGRWGPQPVGEHERDAIQALLDVGGVLLAAGLVLWVLGRLLRGNGAEAPTEDLAAPSPRGRVYDRRRNAFDRRAHPPPARPTREEP